MFIGFRISGYFMIIVRLGNFYFMWEFFNNIVLIKFFIRIKGLNSVMGNEVIFVGFFVIENIILKYIEIKLFIEY